MAEKTGSDKVLDPRNQADEAIKGGKIDPRVASYLSMMADHMMSEKGDRDAKDRLAEDLLEEGFELYSPDGTKKIGTKLIQQAMWRLMSKTKFLNTALHCTGKDEDTERFVTEGVRTVADRGGLNQCFRDKAGVFFSMYLKGNGYVMASKGEDGDAPISFQVIDRCDVYAEPGSLGIRGVRPTDRLVVVKSYPKSKAYEKWPVLREKNVVGKIPGSSYVREGEKDEDIVEVAWAFCLSEKEHLVFAGSTCEVLESLVGDSYPSVKKVFGSKKRGKAFTPVFSFMFQPSTRKFSDYGISDMIADLAIVSSRLFNMELGHIEENVYPVTIINAPQSKVDELVAKMAMANQARANGLKPFVAMEYGPSGTQGTQAQALVTQNLFNEWKVVWDALTRELSRLGVNVDDVDRGSGITRGQVIAEEQASNALIQQTMEYNASETKELMECVTAMIAENVSDGNKSPLNLMTRVTLPDGSTARMDSELTMGMLAKEIREGNWFWEVDSRTGRIPSDLLKMVYQEDMMRITAPGTPEYSELYRMIAAERGVEIKPGKGPAEAQAAQVMAEPGSAQANTPSQTQRMVQDMRSGVSMPV